MAGNGILVLRRRKHQPPRSVLRTTTFSPLKHSRRMLEGPPFDIRRFSFRA